jgi:hypothetical protein
MTDRRHSIHDIVQVEVTYFNSHHQYVNTQGDDNVELLWSSKHCTSIEEHIDIDGKQIGRTQSYSHQVAIPFATISITGFAGMHHGLQCLSEVEFTERGYGFCLESAKTELWKMAYSHLSRHPMLYHDAYYKGDWTRKSVQRTLDECDCPVSVCFPTVWLYWESLDDYTQELDSDIGLVGELDTYRLDEILNTDFHLGRIRASKAKF